MPRNIITTTEAPSSPLFSQGVKAGPLVFVSGTTGVDPGSGQLAGDSIQAQTRAPSRRCQSRRRRRGGCAARGSGRLQRHERGVRPMVPDEPAHAQCSQAGT